MDDTKNAAVSGTQMLSGHEDMLSTLTKTATDLCLLPVPVHLSLHSQPEFGLECQQQ